MKQVKPLNVAIVGGGPGCKAIMDMIFAKKLHELRMELIGVACTNPKDVATVMPEKKGFIQQGITVICTSSKISI